MGDVRIEGCCAAVIEAIGIAARLWLVAPFFVVIATVGMTNNAAVRLGDMRQRRS